MAAMVSVSLCQFDPRYLTLQACASVVCRVLGSPAMTLQEYLEGRAAGEPVPALDLVTLAVKLLTVSSCQAAYKYISCIKLYVVYITYVTRLW